MRVTGTKYVILTYLTKEGWFGTIYVIITEIVSVAKKKKSPKPTLFEVAEPQEGLFTAKQAEEAGFDKRNHSYHVRAGNWIREHRGIYRLANFPRSPYEQYVLWSLWSRGRDDKPRGVYSGQTALSLHELSDVMPAKLHLTVPKSFRRNSKLPKGIVLYYGEVPAADCVAMRGFRVQRPLAAVASLFEAEEVSEDILRQAVQEGVRRGLITLTEIKNPKLPSELREKIREWLKQKAVA